MKWRVKPTLQNLRRIYRVQIGAYSKLENAQNQLKGKEAGFKDAFIQKVKTLRT